MWRRWRPDPRPFRATEQQPVSTYRIALAVRHLRAGGVIAYPTEAVFGIGCDPDDPDAVHRLLAIKRRPWDKGLILIAASLEQLAPYIQPLDAGSLARVQATWPGPYTWLVPADPGTPAWLTGRHSTLAVRVTAHPLAAALCRRFGRPVVSTSANRAGTPPCRDTRCVRVQLGHALDYVLEGAVQGAGSPTPIRDVRTGVLVRAGETPRHPTELAS